MLQVKRRGLPQERTIRTDCISKISVSVCEDFYKRSRCEKLVLNRRSNSKNAIA